MLEWSKKMWELYPKEIRIYTERLVKGLEEANKQKEEDR